MPKLLREKTADAQAVPTRPTSPICLIWPIRLIRSNLQKLLLRASLFDYSHRHLVTSFISVCK